MRISDWSSDVCSSDLTYKALGTEPFWALQIENGKMTFQTPHGPTVIATAIQAGPSFNGWRSTSEPLSVDITFAVCSDGMSDGRYHDTVNIGRRSGRERVCKYVEIGVVAG